MQLKVKNHAKSLFNLMPKNFLKQWLTINPKPCIKPKKTKVQDGPCHNPANIKTKSNINIVFKKLTFFKLRIQGLKTKLVRKLDKVKKKMIAVSPIPMIGIGKTINERLNRASNYE